MTLRGIAGNPTAIGAWVTLELADGSMETNEVQAGSGYFSQSSAACFFGWPDGNPPKKIQVRWPDGKNIEQPIGQSDASLFLSESTP